MSQPTCRTGVAPFTHDHWPLSGPGMAKGASTNKLALNAA
jgi:hypothetical protein